MFHLVDLDRRGLIGAGGALGLAGLWLPGRAEARVPRRGFTHGVASGEPAARSMLLWTRYVGSGRRPVRLGVEVADDPGMTNIVARGEAVADPARDWCAKATVEGLTPGKAHYYRFVAGRSERSMTGRTRTLPEGMPDRFTAAVFSCSNLPYGWFNAYGHAAADPDIDLFVHTGDYLYEYARGKYPSKAEALPGRTIEPVGETVTSSDYHRRFASYRADPDLQRLHAMVPCVVMWDDHESANDAWKDGAENHDPATQGPWPTRLAAARAAYRDWMPVSDRPYAAYDVGDLLTLVRLDTRVEGRDRQLDVEPVLKGAANPLAALVAFRDGPWAAKERTLLGREQEAWLTDTIARSARAGKRWQFVAQQVVMGRVLVPNDATSWLPADADPRVRAFVQAGLTMAKVGLPMNMDSWDGYPAARARLLSAAQAAGASLVVASGDSHNAWAFELAHGGKPAGVEFAGQSVTSPGFEWALPKTPPRVVETGLVAANPELEWCDTARRGYMAIRFTADEVRCEHRFTAPVRTRAAVLTDTVTHTSRRGSGKLVRV